MGKILIDPEDWLTLADAARLRNTTRQAIFKLVKKGRFETFEIAGQTFVNRNSVLSFVEDPPGRKPNKRIV
jgi:hypothetical protein